MARFDDEAISSDETDEDLTQQKGHKVVRRIAKSWVHPKLTRLFHDVIDPRIFAYDPAHPKPGNRPRDRVTDALRESDRQVISTMPRNFYDPAFLEKMRANHGSSRLVQSALDNDLAPEIDLEAVWECLRLQTQNSRR